MTRAVEDFVHAGYPDRCGGDIAGRGRRACRAVSNTTLQTVATVARANRARTDSHCRR